MTAAPAAPDSSKPATSKTLLLVAFATVYVVWGSTYLAIRIAVEHWPPLWLAAVRFAIAGGGLYAVLRLRGAPAPGWRAWLAATAVGGLMLAGGNGTVCWAEQWVPSGETSLILSAGPLWTVLLPWLFRRSKAPRPLVALGVIVGLAGVAVLIGGPQHGTKAVGAAAGAAAGGRALLWARLSLLGASLSWVIGSLIAHRVPLPKAAALATAMEMVVAAPILALAAAAHGDLAHFSFSAIPAAGWTALAYLVVFGSLAGFGSYIYVLVHAGPTRASTGAFVNPLIAVVLGAALASEPIGPRTAIAAAMIIAAVAGVIWGTARR